MKQHCGTTISNASCLLMQAGMQAKPAKLVPSCSSMSPLVWVHLPRASGVVRAFGSESEVLRQTAHGGMVGGPALTLLPQHPEMVAQEEGTCITGPQSGGACRGTAVAP